MRRARIGMRGHERVATAGFGLAVAPLGLLALGETDSPAVTALAVLALFVGAAFAASGVTGVRFVRAPVRTRPERR